MRLIPRDSLVAVPWKNGGGITRQIACFPDGSGMSDFDWRISTAEVSEDGPFSRFEGVDRRLYILEGGGLDLRFASQDTKRLLTGEHLDFPGEAEVFGGLVDGAVSDLNIMVRRGRHRMRAGALGIDGATTIHHGWGAAALFVLSGEITVMGEMARRFDTLLFDAAGDAAVSGTAEALLIGFEALC